MASKKITKTPPAKKSYKSAESAFAAIETIYAQNVAYLKKNFDDFTRDKLNAKGRVRAYYPYVRIATKNRTRSEKGVSYGFVAKPGVYETTLTRPDIFDHYYRTQIALLLKNHGGSIEVGLSDTPIPLHFALGEDFHLEKDLTPLQMEQLPDMFDQPDLDLMDDQIANGTYFPPDGKPMPLSLFTAPRVDLSLLRLKHYTGTKAEHFQNFVIFTNYQFYIDGFIQMAKKELRTAGRSGYSELVEPGEGKPLSRTPQMPAYHLKRADGSGITMINIGVGPSNAKTITDHVAVLRPHAWMMLGHCAGLRNSQTLGDYVLAHGYLREDNILYRDLHPSIPIPALSEIQLALEKAVQEVTGFKGHDMKKVMRTGTVATVDDRNWELRSSIRQNQRLSQSRAIALDMESGTIAANGFRFRVPYGTLLCVSDKPLHGQLKLPGMADNFYRERVAQHLQIGIRAMEILRDIGPDRLHSRKLRSFNEVAFQ